MDHNLETTPATPTYCVQYSGTTDRLHTCVCTNTSRQQQHRFILIHPCCWHRRRQAATAWHRPRTLHYCRVSSRDILCVGRVSVVGRTVRTDRDQSPRFHYQSKHVCVQGRSCRGQLHCVNEVSFIINSSLSLILLKIIGSTDPTARCNSASVCM
jgi:hypothetical protein